MRGFFVSRFRRRVGVITVLAMARHRLARVPFIGAPRQAVVAQMQQQRGVGDPRPPYLVGPGHADFFQFQAQPAWPALGA